VTVSSYHKPVIPAKAGISCHWLFASQREIPAFAGMTERGWGWWWWMGSP